MAKDSETLTPAETLFDTFDTFDEILAEGAKRIAELREAYNLKIESVEDLSQTDKTELTLQLSRDIGEVEKQLGERLSHITSRAQDFGRNTFNTVATSYLSEKSRDDETPDERRADAKKIMAYSAMIFDYTGESTGRYKFLTRLIAGRKPNKSPVGSSNRTYTIMGGRPSGIPGQKWIDIHDRTMLQDQNLEGKPRVLFELPLEKRYDEKEKTYSYYNKNTGTLMEIDANDPHKLLVEKKDGSIVLQYLHFSNERSVMADMRTVELDEIEAIASEGPTGQEAVHATQADLPNIINTFGPHHGNPDEIPTGKSN